MSETACHSEIDFAAEGKQQGYIRLPHSVHRSAYGFLPIPIVQIKRGDGPRALVMAGVHGDEYEGQLAISKLIQSLEPAEVTGTLILLPMANYPAALAGLRTSPIDDGNLNRLFPGDPNGGPSQMIAHYIEHELMTRVDTVIDLHSGGSSLEHLPVSFADPGDSDESKAAAVGALKAFGLPYGALYDRRAHPNHTCGAGLRQGAISLSAELGGAGTVTPTFQRGADEGLTRLLEFIGCLKSDANAQPSHDRVMIVETGAEELMYAAVDGVFEPLIDLGDHVRAGQTCAMIHTPETPWLKPTPVTATTDGIAVVRRFPARVQRGDCIFQLVREIPDKP